MNELHGAFDSRQQRLMRAAEWFARLRQAQDTKLVADDLREWRSFISDPQNRAAFAAVQRSAFVVRSMPHPPLPSAAELQQDDYEGSVPVSQWLTEHPKEAPPARRARAQSFWRPAQWTLVAAAALVLIFQAFRWGAPPESLNDRSVQVFETGPGEHRQVTLVDGSGLDLGARTRVTARFFTDRRVLHLDNGEALFTVAKDPTRPFVVFTGTRRVTAVGTQFNIRRELERTTVTVTEGTVEVAPANAPPVAVDVLITAMKAQDPQASLFRKGQAVTYAAGHSDIAVEPAADLSSAVAWREGRLVYRRTDLKYVIADVNRYFRQEIVLGDRAAGELQFSGTVLQSQSPEDFLRALESIFPIEVTRIDDAHVLIRSLTKNVALPTAAAP